MVITNLSSRQLASLAPVLAQCAERGVMFSINDEDHPLVVIHLRDEASGHVESFVGDNLAQACDDALAWFRDADAREVERAEKKAYGNGGP